MFTIVITSGYFVWLHQGHIELFKKARKLGDALVVILNNDKQQKLKYGKVIVPFEQRKKVLKSIKWIDGVIESGDQDRTVVKSIEDAHEKFCMERDDSGAMGKLKEMIFAKGGDRFKNEIPEKEICDKLRIKIIDGLGEKIQSTSNLIKNATISNP